MPTVPELLPPGLALSAFLLGLAGTPHCVAMCAAPCETLLRRLRGGAPARLAWQGGRLLAYAAAGALMASGYAALNALGAASGLLRPLWLLVQVFGLALGAWWLLMGRWPAALDARLAESLRGARAPAPSWALASAASAPGRGGPRMIPIQPVDPRPPRRPGPLLAAAAAGLAWVGWPCGLLWSALILASQAPGALGGALVMAGFALGGGAGLALLPRLGAGLLARLGLGGPAVQSLGLRLAGASLLAAAAWTAWGPGLPGGPAIC